MGEGKKQAGLTENLGICWCLEHLGLDQNATVEEANQSYVYLYQMVNLLHSESKDPDQQSKRYDKLSLLEYAYQIVIDHIHVQAQIAIDDRISNDINEQPNVRNTVQIEFELQNAKKEKLKADAAYSIAMDALQKAVKSKREADMRWLAAIENCNASRLDSSKGLDLNKAGVEAISQNWHDSERRKQPRIKFNQGKNPILNMDGKQYRVVDISRGGIRFQAGSYFGHGRLIRGQLYLPDVASMKIVGKVIRATDDEAAAKLITRIADTLILDLSCQSIINSSDK
jgi:hypothetical protein